MSGLERLEAARERYQALILQCDRFAVRQGLSETLQQLSALALRLDDADAALKHASRAIEVMGRRTPPLLHQLARSLHLSGDPRAAAAAAEEAVGLLDEQPRQAIMQVQLRDALEQDLIEYRRAMK
jgi:hypothetical protein